MLKNKSMIRLKKKRNVRKIAGYNMAKLNCTTGNISGLEFYIENELQNELKKLKSECICNLVHKSRESRDGYLTNDKITHYKWLPRIFPFTKTNQIINYLCL